jgi:hypothetical protein
MSGRNVVGTHPSAHPQHMNIFKHLVYVWHWCTSTAYEGCQTPWICTALMWDEHGLGLQHQSPHFTITYWLGVAQISSKIPKAWSAWAAITWWGHIHLHIHIVKHLVYVWHWCEMNMGWVYSLNHRISPSLIGWELPRFLAKSQKLAGRHERK